MIKLLLVEDDANLCYIIRGGLEDMIGGYEVMTASNGEEGLKIWKEQHLDIIISDIEMPVMDGYEMVRRIRETDGFIPIVFTSGRVSPKDVVKGYELGVNNYIKKPFLAEELDAHIGALLKMKRGMGVAKRIKKAAFDLSRKKFPHAKLFGLTTGEQVMRINTELGYVPVTFAKLTDDEQFWAGCKSCVNYDILLRTNMTKCLCTGMVYDPEVAAKREADKKLEEKKQSNGIVKLLKKVI
jgi:CheY-like chemotaxis protein